MKNSNDSIIVELQGRIRELEQENSQVINELKEVRSNMLHITEENDLHSIFCKSLKEFFWIIDHQGNILGTNQYAIDRLEYTKEELHSMNVLELHPAHRLEETKKILSGLLDGTRQICPMPLVTRTGKSIPVETNIVKGNWRNKPLIFGVSKDISKLRLSEKKFSKVFQMGANSQAISDYYTGEYIDVNDNFLETFELTREQTIGKTSCKLGLLPLQLREEIQKKTDENNTFKNLEIKLERNGKTIYGLFSGTTFYLQDKKCWLTTMQDITKLRQVEKDFTNSERRWKFALEGAGDGLWDWDMQTDNVYYSNNWKSMLGYSPHEIEGHLDEWEKRVFPDDLKNCHKEIKRHITGQTDMYSSIHRVKCKGGNYKWILDRGKIVEFSKENKPLRFIGTHHDLTERMKIEQELLKANSDKDRFMQILAHDLRSPFNSILGFSELILQRLKNADYTNIEEQLGIINKMTKKTYQLLNDLLTWSKVQSGKITYTPERLSIQTIATGVIERYTHNKKNIIIQYSPDPDVIVYSDKNMLKSILRNLIVNAIKFTPLNGTVTIFAQADKMATIAVSDTGIGISEEDQKKMWDFKKPLTRKGTQGEEGTGFGLQICKDFVEIHGGKIWVESKLHKGSTFKFTVPLYRPD